MTNANRGTGHWGGIRPLHHEPRIPGLAQIPEIFTRSESARPLAFNVVTDRRLNVAAARKAYVLDELAIRVVNACLLLPEYREEWISPGAIAQAGTPEHPYDNSDRSAPYTTALVAPYLMRALEYLDTLRQDADGAAAFIERRRRGSSEARLHGYRIHPDIIFNDKR